MLPDVAFRDELTFWCGPREFRLLSMTGDATGSAVLYLPAEKILVTGDVLVSPLAGIIDGVQRALERGVYRADDIVAAVNVDAIGRQYPKGHTGPDSPFGAMVARLVRKAAQEALDGVAK